MKIIDSICVTSAHFGSPIPTAICVHCGAPVVVRQKDLDLRSNYVEGSNPDKVMAFIDERRVVCCDDCEQRENALEVPNTREISFGDAWTPAIVEVSYRIIRDPQPISRGVHAERAEQV